MHILFIRFSFHSLSFYIQHYNVYIYIYMMISWFFISTNFFAGIFFCVETNFWCLFIFRLSFFASYSSIAHSLCILYCKKTFLSFVLDFLHFKNPNIIFKYLVLSSCAGNSYLAFLFTQILSLFYCFCYTIHLKLCVEKCYEWNSHVHTIIYHNFVAENCWRTFRFVFLFQVSFHVCAMHDILRWTEILVEK